MAVLEVNEESFEKEVLKEKKVVVVDLYADWCGPCRMLKPALKKLSEEEPQAKFVSVNVDNNPSLAEQFQVYSIPCIVFIKNGKEANRSVGLVPKDELKSILKGI